MATVEVTFTPLAAHVRTARLVATAVARRSGVAESLLDEVRLAVGEACSRAVEAHQLHCPAEPVRIALTDLAGRFEIEVVNTSQAPVSPEAARTGASGPGLGSGPDPGGGAAAGPDVGRPGDAAVVPPGFSLAVIAGLADDVQISETAAGTSIRMSWPSAGSLAHRSPA
jgi:serine/threonine-protein kinase RsbW